MTVLTGWGSCGPMRRNEVRNCQMVAYMRSGLLNRFFKSLECRYPVRLRVIHRKPPGQAHLRRRVELVQPFRVSLGQWQEAFVSHRISHPTPCSRIFAQRVCRRASRPERRAFIQRLLILVHRSSIPHVGVASIPLHHAVKRPVPSGHTPNWLIEWSGPPVPRGTCLHRPPTDRS